MRAAIYARVSQDRNVQGRSVDEQEAECRRFCQAQGWATVAYFEDNDRSASRYARKTRPEYQRLRTFVAGGGCDVLVTWEASRSQRDLEEYAKLARISREAGVPVVLQRTHL
jgi:site-specific DNA recombinase